MKIKKEHRDFSLKDQELSLNNASFKKTGQKKIPVVAICGRPNVGKSTLFNRILGERKAVISKTPGTTRDRIYSQIEWRGESFILIDTGGMIAGKKYNLEADIQKQIEVAVKESDLILLVVEIAGFTKEDFEVLEFLRKTSKKIILVVNKVDHMKMIEKAPSEIFSQKDIGEPIFVSAIHNMGIGDLLDKIVEFFPQEKKVAALKIEEKINVAICGRPNVGKSSLLNKLLGEERVIVSEKPGTTRDAIDVEVSFKEGKVVFIDTAGIRRRGKIRWGEEKFSVLRALKTIEKADIVILLLDAQEGVTKQDLHIAQHALENNTGIILAVNKWDSMELKIKNEKLKMDKAVEDYLSYLRSKISFLPWAPVVFISALTGKNIKKVLDLIFKISKERKKDIRIKELNKIIKEAILEHPPPRIKTKREFPKIYYITQLKGTPPTFVFMTNFPKAIHFSYKRYLENVIRKNFGFDGTAIKMIFKRKKGN